jgi:DNA processing protein
MRTAERENRGAGELEALVLLRCLPGLPDSRLRELLGQYGSARAIVAAGAVALGAEASAAMESAAVRGRVARALDSIARHGVRVLTEADPAYPTRLLALHDPPPVLFARGRLELLERPAIAIVGARRHTEYGRAVATAFAGALARAGVVVVSGMARGIDAIAHEAALPGGTIGVLGCGIDVVYPREHAALHRRVAAAGLLLSEFPPGAPALRYHFPKRNRLIAALSRGVLVVEASAKSGSLITVDHALDLGLDVFAIPGPIDRPTSEGTNALIREGAKLVTGVDDILDELGIARPTGLSAAGAGVGSGNAFDIAIGHHGTEADPGAGGFGAGAPEPTGLDGPELALWRALGERPRHVDELAAACALDPAGALARLLTLELAGYARQLAGMRFVRG